jgi:uncharacterized protein YqhQ
MKSSPLNKVIETLMYVFSFALAIGLFFMLPAWLGKLIGGENEVTINIIEGVLRLGIFVGYIWVVSFIPDIRRVFQYHGAEHKTVNAYEAGSDLDIDDVISYPTFHPRCGTSFIFFLIIVTIILFTILHLYIPALAGTWPRILSRVILLPFVAGMAYECIRITGKYPNSWFSQIVILPGKLFQRMTSREPSPDMVEVAIYAFKGAMGDPAIIQASEDMGKTLSPEGAGGSENNAG